MATRGLPIWMLAMTPEEFAQLQEEQWASRRRDQIFQQGVHSFSQGTDGVSVCRPRGRAPNHTYGHHVSKLEDARMEQPPFPQRQPSASWWQDFENPGYNTDFQRGPIRRRAHSRNGSMSVVPPPYRRQGSVPQEHQHSRGVSLQPEVVDLTNDGDDQFVKDEGIEHEEDPIPVLPPDPAPKRATARGRSANPNTASKHRFRSAGDVSRPRKRTLRMADILQAPRVREAIQKKGHSEQARTRSEKEFPDGCDIGSPHGYVAQVLGDGSQDLPSARGNNSDPSYPAATTTGNDRPRHKNLTGAHQTFASSLHYHDQMPYAVPPLLRASSSFVTTTPRQRRKNLSGPRGGAASSVIKKDIGRIGVGGHNGIRETSVGPQSTKNDQQPDAPASKKSRLGGRLPFQQDSSPAASSNPHRSSSRIEVNISEQPVIASGTPSSADFDQVDAEEHDQNGEMVSLDEMFAKAQKKKEAIELKAREQKCREAAQRSRVSHDPFPENMRQLGTQVEPREGKKRLAEAEGSFRNLSGPEGRVNLRAEKEIIQEAVEPLDPAATRAKKLKELKEQAINKAKVAPGASATTSINSHNRRDSVHAKINGENHALVGSSKWSNGGFHGGTSDATVRERLTPQHMSPPPRDRLPNGQNIMSVDEPLFISSDESSSGGESEDDEQEEEVKTAKTPRSCLKRPWDRLDEAGPSTPSKKVCVVTPSEEAEFGSNAKRRFGGPLPRLPTEAPQEPSQSQEIHVPTEKPVTQQQSTMPSAISKAVTGRKPHDSNGGSRHNSYVTTPEAAGHAPTKKEENSLFVSDTSSSDHSSDDERREAAQVTPKQREKNEKAARRRWERKAEEKTAKGEDPEVFVYKPKGPPRKPVSEAGPPHATAIAATIEAIEKEKPKRVPKPKTSPALQKSKQNVQQNTMDRSSLFGAPQPQEDTPSSSTSPSDGEVGHTTPTASDKEQAPGDGDVEMREHRDSLDDLFEEREDREDPVTETATDSDVIMQDAQNDMVSVTIPCPPPSSVLSGGMDGFVPTEHVESASSLETLSAPNRTLDGVGSGDEDGSNPLRSDKPHTSPPMISAELNFGEVEDFFMDEPAATTTPDAALASFENKLSVHQLCEQSPVVNSISNGLLNEHSETMKPAHAPTLGELPQDRKFKKPSLRRAKKSAETSKVEPERRGKNYDTPTGGFLPQLQPIEPVKEVPQTAAVFATTFTDDHVKPASSYEIDLSALDETDPVVEREPTRMMSSTPAAAQKPLKSNTNRVFDPKVDRASPSRGAAAPKKTTVTTINTSRAENLSVAQSSFQSTTDAESRGRIPIEALQSTTPSNTPPLQPSKASDRNGRALPKIKKFLKKPIDDWVWVEAKQFLENGRCEPKDLAFFMNNRNALQDMLELKKSEAAYDEEFREEESDEDGSSERPAAVTSKKRPSQTQPAVGRAVASHRGELTKPTAADGASPTPRKMSPRAGYRSKALTSIGRTTNRKPCRQLSQTALANRNHPTTHHQEGNQLLRRAPKPTNHREGLAPSSHQILQQTRPGPPAEDLPARPTLGGKSINNPEIRAMIDKLKSTPEVELSASVTTNDSETEEHPRGHHREASPITEADEVHNEFTVRRKQWRLHEHEGDADWFNVQEPFYETRQEAEEALERETRVIFQGIAYNPSSCVRLVQQRNGDDQLEWKAEMPKCTMLLQVVRTVRRKGDHTLPNSKEGWLPAKIWWIKKQSWTRRRRSPLSPEPAQGGATDSSDEDGHDNDDDNDVPQVAEAAQADVAAREDADDDDDGDELERQLEKALQEGEEQESTSDNADDNAEREHNPQTDNNQTANNQTDNNKAQHAATGSGNSEEYEYEYEGQEQHPDGVWTDLIHANKHAADWYMHLAFNMDPKCYRIDDVKAREEGRKWIKMELQRTNQLKIPFNTTRYSGDGKKTVKVWVEATSVNGPKNP